MMNIFQHLHNYQIGASTIIDWLGHQGIAVDPEVAQRRANVCLMCPQNQDGIRLTEAVGQAIKEQLEAKNQIGLRVEGEKSLHSCNVCGCYNRLSVWCPSEYLYKYTTDQELEQYPQNCWKRNKQ